MKKSIFTFALLTMIFGWVGSAHAVAFLDFEPPAFSRDNSGPGDYDHFFSSSDGNIEFNGRILNRLGGAILPDHTIGTRRGSFLKNTGKNAFVTFKFDYDVSILDFYAHIEDGFIGHVEIFDFDGQSLFSDEGTTTDLWENANLGGPDFRIRQFQFWTTDADDNVQGNRGAIDDLTITASAPEPATVFLVSMGLAGFGLKRRKSFAKA